MELFAFFKEFIVNQVIIFRTFKMLFCPKKCQIKCISAILHLSPYLPALYFLWTIMFLSKKDFDGWDESVVNTMDGLNINELGPISDSLIEPLKLWQLNIQSAVGNSSTYARWHLQVGLLMTFHLMATSLHFGGKYET